MPHPERYYLSSQLQHLMGCDVPGGGTPNGRIVLTEASHNTIIETLEADSFGYRSPTIKMITKIWKTVKKQMGYNGLTEYTPLWNNYNLRETLPLGKVREWEIHGIKRLRQLYLGNTFKKFSDLR